MDRTPSEIWIKIFGYACTDSGSTGRRLSIVSRFIREAAASVKLQSISVHGLPQTISFHKLLLQAPPHLRRTRYLFLSTIPLPPAPRGSECFATSVQTSEGDSGGPHTEDEERQQFCDACTGILAKVADSVEILYLDVPARHLWNFPKIYFPRLEELASNGFPVVLEDSRVKPEPDCALCPRICRWHLIGYPYMWKGESVFETIRATAPLITHIRFSCLWKRGSAIPFIGLPENIQHVYVKPGATPSHGRGYIAVSKRSYIRLTRGLEELNVTDNRLVLLPPYHTNQGAIICTLDDWEERINGGDGCWSLRERVLV